MPWTKWPPLDRVRYTTLPADSVVVRCFQLERGATTFWPSQERFGAAPRSMLYTGDTDAAAVGETLLRDPMPYPDTSIIALPFDHLRRRGLARLRLRRDVAMISLRRPAIYPLLDGEADREALRELLEQTGNYAPSSAFANALLEQAPEVAALSWPSRRVDGETVFCFYTSQVSADDFDVVDEEPFTSEAGFARLVNAIAIAGLQLATSRPIAGVVDDDP